MAPPDGSTISSVRPEANVGVGPDLCMCFSLCICKDISASSEDSIIVTIQIIHTIQ